MDFQSKPSSYLSVARFVASLLTVVMGRDSPPRHPSWHRANLSLTIGIYPLSVCSSLARAPHQQLTPGTSRTLLSFSVTTREGAEFERYSVSAVS